MSFILGIIMMIAFVFEVRRQHLQKICRQYGHRYVDGQCQRCSKRLPMGF